MKKVVALGVPRVKSRKVGAPESAVGRLRAVEAEAAGKRRDLFSGRNAEICRKEFVNIKKKRKRLSVFFLFLRTGNKRVASLESSGSFGDGRRVEMKRHGGGIGHELSRGSRAAKVVDLLLVASDGDEGRHPVRPIAAIYPKINKK